MPQAAIKHDLDVGDGGRIEVQVPFAAGTRVTVFVVQQQADEFESLLDASRSSLDFWDNAWDGEDWNS